MKTMLETALDDELCRFLVSWHRYEERSGKLSIIDFDLVGLCDLFDEDIKRSHLDYIRWSETLLSKLSDAGLVQSFEYKKLRAHAFALRALAGQNFPLEDYVEATMGFRTLFYPDSALSSVASEVERRCSELHVSHDALVPSSFDEPQFGPDPSDIENAFRIELERLTASINEQFQVALDFSLEVEFVDVDAYWSYWIDGSGKNYRLRFNRSQRTYGMSEVTQFCLHELIGHCGQALGWYKAPHLSRFTRLLTVHSCEQVHLEGLGQGLPFLLPNICSGLVALRALVNLLRQMLLNNAYLALSRGHRIEDVISDSNRFLPLFDNIRLAKNLADQVYSPVMRTYMFSYPKGVELAYLLSKQREKSSAFIKRSFTEPMMVTEIQALLDADDHVTRTDD